MYLLDNVPKKVIIIGAGRSGTNMLRDALVKLQSCDTWDCDEINYIWRYSNRSHPSDELSSVHANVKAVKYINRVFDKFAERSKCEYIVEKTCANSLRVSFVDTVFDSAYYLNIVRDGGDVVSSAFDRWTANVDPGYLMKKVKYVPPMDLPFYIARYASHRLQRVFREDNSLPSWGPVYTGMPDDVQNLTIPEVCALQWKNCVERSSTQLSISKNTVLTIVYEEFVKDPRNGMQQILEFIGLSADEKSVGDAVSNISDRSVGKGGSFVSSHPQAAEIIRSVECDLGLN